MPLITSLHPLGKWSLLSIPTYYCLLGSVLYVLVFHKNKTEMHRYCNGKEGWVKVVAKNPKFLESEAPLFEKRYKSCLTSSDGKLFFWLGNPKNVLLEFDPITLLWKNAMNLPDFQVESNVIVGKDKIYVCGLKDEKGGEGQLNIITRATGETQTVSLPAVPMKKRYSMHLVELNNYIYIIVINDFNRRLLYRYDKIENVIIKVNCGHRRPYLKSYSHDVIHCRCPPWVADGVIYQATYNMLWHTIVIDCFDESKKKWKTKYQYMVPNKRIFYALGDKNAFYLMFEYEMDVNLRIVHRNTTPGDELSKLTQDTKDSYMNWLDKKILAVFGQSSKLGQIQNMVKLKRIEAEEKMKNRKATKSYKEFEKRWP